MNSTRIAKQRSPISLAFLFNLMTFGGIISACLRTLTKDGSVTTEALGALILLGVVIGAVAGGVLGLFYFRSFSLTAIACVCGVGVGAIAGAVALIHSDRFLEIGAIACSGSWAVVLAMCLVARNKKIPEH